MGPALVLAQIIHEVAFSCLRRLSMKWPLVAVVSLKLSVSDMWIIAISCNHFFF